MKLSEDQENKIKLYVDTHGVKIQTLRDDIIDHICCVVESRLKEDVAFEQLLEEAVADLAPTGLNEIQNETLFLLNSRKILLMKKLMYTIGFIGSVTLTAGVTFKLLHLPYGFELFSVGFLTLFLIFIPLLAIDRYKVTLSKAISVRLKFTLGTMAAIIVGLSGLFKLLHLQGAVVLMLAGSMIFTIGFLPFYFFTMYKKSIS